MPIRVRFSDDDSLRGSPMRKRRERIAELMSEIPADVVDESGKPVVVTVERIPKNLYDIEVSVPNSSQNPAILQITNFKQVRIKSGDNRGFIYFEPAKEPVKYAMKDRGYSFEVVKGEMLEG